MKAQNTSVPAGRLLRAVRAVCLLLVIALPGLSSVPASAQGTFLVSNLGGDTPDSLNVNQYRLARGFTTGPAVDGYMLESVVLRFGTISNADQAARTSVTLRRGDGADPTGRVVATLARSSDLVADSDNEFLAQGGIHLLPNRRYWVVLQRTDGTRHSAETSWISTNQAAETNFGWTLDGSRARVYGAQSWLNTGLSSGFALGIKGTEVGTTPTAPPPTPVADSRTRALAYNLASIGRTATATLVDHIWDRAARVEPGGRTALAMVGGHVIGADAFAESGDAQRRSGAAVGVLPGAAQSGAADKRALRGHPDGPRDFAPDLLPDDRALLGQTRLELTSDGKSGAIGSLAFWGRGDFTAFESDGGDAVPDFSTEGEVVSGHFGIDYRASPQVLFGIAAGHSRGETSHALAGSDDRDKLKTELLSVHPYLYWTPVHSNRVWWGMVGWGTGDATLTEGTDRTRTDLSLRTYAGGVREASHLGALEVAVKADAFLAEIVADGVESLSETTGKASRVRAALEGTRDWALEGDTSLSGTVEIGLRVDSRDAASGKGADLAGKLHYASSGHGLDVTLRGSTLLTHGNDGYREWGAGLLLVYDPGVSGRGLRLTLSPSWNTPHSGVARALWNAGPISRQASSGRGAALGIRLGYAMRALQDHARMTVYGEADSDGGARRVRLGSELRPTGASRFGLHVYGERQDRRAGGGNALGLQLDLAL